MGYKTKKTNVEKEAIREILKNCNWLERIFIKIFYKEFEKMYNIIRIELMNVFLS